MKKSKCISNRMDMLNGSIFDKILLFALPLAISSILQQLFNSVDVAVVGRFASSEALAAVGSNSSVISLLINLFVGISVGANVVIANYISTGILLAPSGIFVTYNSSSALMKWRYKSEMRVKALIWSVICQQRLSSQFRHEDVHGLILGNSMDLAYQILTSTGGRKHDFFMLDGSYEHFLYLTNDHQGEVTLALLCDPGKTAELDRILLQGLTARQPGLAIEHDGISPDGSPVLFGYFCDLPRIARFNTSLELSERPGTLICFDFQAEVLRSYCGSRVRFQTIDFTKFEGRLFP